jgi:Sensors of blue-light using FAD
MLITSSTPLSREPVFGGGHRSSDGWLSSLAYRSKARTPQDHSSLSRLVESSQARNKAHDITGQLVYEDQRFFQWLEGPAEEVARLWNSIKQDDRHGDIEVLGNQEIPARFFGDWSLKLEINPGTINMPKTASTEEPVLQELIKNIVIPQLAARHSADPKKTIRPVAHPRVMELAKLLISNDPSSALQLFEDIHSAVPSLNQFYASVIEPTARALGDFWKTEQCTEFAVTAGLCRLQTAIRSMGSISPWQTSPDGPLKAVLVAPQPGELHMLGAVLDDDILLRAGWQTQCEFPSTDEDMQTLVSNTWFDALDLSLSVAFSREQWLPRLTETIAKARIASCNPELVVVVGGRVFYEQPGLEKTVGANGASSTALDVGTLIMRELVATTKRRH